MNNIDVEQVLPNPDQPRTEFDEEELRGLAQSIKQNGLIQPIVVEQVAENQYVLIDGERRLRAVKSLGWSLIDAVVRPPSEEKNDKLLRALVANVQRSSMGFVDEAKAYKRLLNELGTVPAVAFKTGVAEPTIYARIRLLSLAPAVQEYYNQRRLPFDLSVIAIFERLKPEDQEQLASNAVTRGLRTSTILRAGSRMLGETGKKSTKRGGVPESVSKFKGHFNALALVKGKPPKSIQLAVVHTCTQCPVYDQAGPQVCGRCPLPIFLKELSSKAKETK